jgi:metal-responsive CopG/Arc/MetJ family transcriptional regulator
MRTYKKFKMVARNISLTDDLYNTIKEVAQKESKTVSELLRDLARDYIKKQQKTVKDFKQAKAVNQ